MMNAYQKTEALLYDYSSYKLGVELKQKYNTGSAEMSEAYCNKVEDALDHIDKYDADLVRMYYFKRYKLEYMAEILDVSRQTVHDRKRRIINRLKAILFPDDALAELIELKRT